jgi:hypothetical protein
MTIITPICGICINLSNPRKSAESAETCGNLRNLREPAGIFGNLRNLRNLREPAGIFGNLREITNPQISQLRAEQLFQPLHKAIPTIHSPYAQWIPPDHLC